MYFREMTYFSKSVDRTLGSRTSNKQKKGFIKDIDNLIPSAPMETSFTPLLVMKSKALLTFAIL